MTVLVTGGARRIGRAIVNALAAGGWRVLVHSRLPGDQDAEALAREVGGVALSADLSDPLGPARLFNAAVEAAPDISALVNNAAVFSAEDELSADALAEMESVNVEAPRKLTTMLAMRLGKTFTPEQVQAYTTDGGAPFLDGEYTVFGEVVRGMTVVDKIAAQQKDAADRPLDDIKIISATIME